MNERRAGQARPRMYFSFVTCTYFIFFVYIFLRGTREKEKGVVAQRSAGRG